MPGSLDSPGLTSDGTASKAGADRDDSEDESLSDSLSESESEESEESLSPSSSEEEEEEEPVEGGDVIVIQPGSLNIRIGLASDPFPKIFPNCIARRRTENNKTDHDEAEKLEEDEEGDWFRNLDVMDSYIRKLKGSRKSKSVTSQVRKLCYKGIP